MKLHIGLEITPAEGVDTGLIDIAITALRSIRAHALGEPFGPAADASAVTALLGGAPQQPAPVQPAAPVPPAPAAPALPPGMFPEPAPAPAPHVAAAPTPAPAPAAGTVDKNGVPWDGRIHSSNQKLTSENVWQRRRNIPDAEFARITAELLQQRGAPIAAAPAAPVPPVPPVPPAPPIAPPVAAAPVPPVPPVPPAVDPGHTAPPPMPGAAVPPLPTPAVTFASVMERVMSNQALFTPDTVKLWVETLELKGVHELASPTNVEKLHTFNAWLDQKQAGG